MKNTILILMTTVSILALANSGTANAYILYDAPLYNGPDGGPFSNYNSQLFANEFSISGGGAISKASWYGAAYYGLPFGSFNVAFFADSSGVPGSLLTVDTVTPTIVDTGDKNGYGKELYIFSAAIPTFTAGAGVSYYFSVSDLGSFNFEWANSNLTAKAAYSENGTNGPWRAALFDRQSQAFTLEAVPEPSTWAMTLVGFAALGFAASRASRRRIAGLA